MSAETTSPTLYDRLGGVYSIAAVVDDFIDRVMHNPILNANPAVDEAHHRVSAAGFKPASTMQTPMAIADRIIRHRPAPRRRSPRATSVRSSLGIRPRSATGAPAPSSATRFPVTEKYSARRRRVALLGAAARHLTMKPSLVAALVAAVSLAGCQTATQQKVWMRADGKRGAGNPGLQAEFLSQRAQCRAIADQTARSMIPPPSPVIQQTVVVERSRRAGEIDFISENPATRAYRDAEPIAPRGPDPEAFAAAMEGCMAQQGYILGGSGLLQRNLTLRAPFR